jgi:hypothetical protein
MRAVSYTGTVQDAIRLAKTIDFSAKTSSHPYNIRIIIGRTSFVFAVYRQARLQLSAQIE